MLVVFCVLSLSACGDSPAESQKLYGAWKRAHPQYADMPYGDWAVLRSNDMLPGVDYTTLYAKRARDAAESASTTSAINLGMSAASSGMTRGSK